MSSSVEYLVNISSLLAWTVLFEAMINILLILSKDKILMIFLLWGIDKNEMMNDTDANSKANSRLFAGTCCCTCNSPIEKCEYSIHLQLSGEYSVLFSYSCNLC